MSLIEDVPILELSLSLRRDLKFPTESVLEGGLTLHL